MAARMLNTIATRLTFATTDRALSAASIAVPHASGAAHLCQKTAFASWARARWSHRSRRCRTRLAAHSHFGCGAPSPAAPLIAVGIPPDDEGFPRTALGDSIRDLAGLYRMNV